MDPKPPQAPIPPQEIVAIEVRHFAPSLRRWIRPVLWSFGTTLSILAFSFSVYAVWQHMKNGYSYAQIVSSDLPLIPSGGRDLHTQVPAAGAVPVNSSGSNSSSAHVTATTNAGTGNPYTAPGSSGHSGGSGGTQTPPESGGGPVTVKPVTDSNFTGEEVPTTITADCSRNVTADLNAWMASVPDGTAIGFKGGCFRIDQTLTLSNRHNLLIDGQGATFKAIDPTGDSSVFDAQAQCAGGYGGTPSKAARTRSQWNVHGSSNITFINMTVSGANPCGGTGSPAYVAALEAQHAFNIDGGNSNITLHDLTAVNTYGDFIYFRGTTNGHVYNCHFERDGRQGISVTSGGPILVENNYIANTRRATVDLEPNTSSNIVDGVTLRNNTVGAGRLLFVAAHGSGPVNNVVIEKNTLTRCMSISVQGSASLRRHNWTVQNNTTTGGCGSPAPGAPMNFSYVDYVRVLNNVQPIQKNRGDNGVNISYVTDIQVNGNSFVNAAAALYGYSNWTGDSNYSSCGNQLVPGGAYDQPKTCGT